MSLEMLPEGDSSHLRERRMLKKLNPGIVPEEEVELPKTGRDYASLFWKFESIFSPVLITLLSLQIRFKDIGVSKIVVWDEAHFGKFGSQYLKHTFYHDVHPVLGKMLIGLSGYLAGYDGSFKFESSKAYPDDLDYVTMRMFNCLFSVFTPTVAYYTAKALDFNVLTTYLISMMVTYETSFVALSKFILLDSMLLFFTATTFLTLIKFHKVNKPQNQFTFTWLKWLILSGISIGCVCSVKWVGLFVTVVYGLYTILELLIRHYDVKLSRPTYYAQWLTRIITLILIPFVIYLLCFYVHFSLLYKSGDGVKSTSTLFQMNLDDHDIELTQRDIYYGSKVSIRSQGLSPNLLHSHYHSYPEGSGQQQITTYGYKDENNNFIIHFPRESQEQIDYATYNNLTHLTKIKDGDKIRLSHELTKANVHSHDIPAFFTKSAYEVSGYGNLEIGDDKDDWIVEITEQLYSSNSTYTDLYETHEDFESDVHPVSTSFRLRHKVLGCYLATSGLAYPKWGFQQGEVICKNSWSSRDKSTWWNVEDHWNSNKQVNEADQHYQPPKSKFWRDFVLINFAMALSNNALVPDLDKLDNLASSAWEWPVVHVGLRMCAWGNNQTRYYLMSLPSTTWSSTISLLVFVLLTLVQLIKYQRQVLVLTKPQVWYYIMGGVFPFVAWLLHYLPFAVMSRVTYVHHYVPALYFAIFVEGFLFDYLSHTLPNGRKFLLFKALVYITAISGTLVCFWYFSPICLGMKGPKRNFEYLKWFDSWTMV